MVEPGRVRARHDPIAMSLAKQFPGVRMPDLGLAETDAGDVLAYLEAETKRLRGETSKGHKAHRHAGHAGHAASSGDGKPKPDGNHAGHAGMGHHHKH
jgi:hypothetical protein